MKDINSWTERNERLRKGVVRKRKGTQTNEYLLASFTGTKQGEDIQKRTALMQDDFFRTKINVKLWSPREAKKKGKEVVDFHDNAAIFESMEDEFDMSLWAFMKNPKAGATLQDHRDVFIYQIKGCNIRCPWCFVDDINKNCQMGNGSAFWTASEVIDAFEQERRKQPLYIIRPSGGEPTLAPEQWLEGLRELQRRGLDDEIYLRSDTNLTTGSFMEHLERIRQVEPYLLNKIGEYSNFGVLCSFKGTDVESMLHAIGFEDKRGNPNFEYSFLYDERWRTFDALVDAGIDAYPFIYDPNPDTLVDFMEEGAKRYGDGFYLKTWMFGLKLYGPEKERLERVGKDPEQVQKELDRNFARSYIVMQDLIWDKFGVNYQAIPRPGIELKVKNRD